MLFPLHEDVVPGAVLMAFAFALLSLLLLGSAVLTCWAVLFPSHRWAILPRSQGLKRLALAWYLIIACLFFLLASLQAFGTGESIADVFFVLGFGVLVLPGGLVLAIIGGNLIAQGRTRTNV
jgi:hypothetical protein